MKKVISVLMVLFAAVCLLQAQVVIDYSDYARHSNTSLKMVLQDSKTFDPISFATVYLVPQNDTIITNFALSGENGLVEIKDIVPGRYTVNAEMIGYKPYRMEHNIRARGWYETDLGVVLMEENPEFIDAATITAVGNAVTVQGDTLTYNASSFRVGENAMLEDLLKKMPGMKVESDGSVTVNGEAVDKITVGGKTFFFSDPAMAVKNLPAKVVDKIKVIDKKKEEAEFSGVGTKDEKEKVMDVELKEEYQKGWFGNARISGGAPLGKDEEEMRGVDGALFNSNAMMAGYNETDQITFLGNARNAAEPGGGSIMVFNYGDDIDEFSARNGLITSAQVGANYNTERIKGFESSANVSYGFSRKDAREKKARTSFQTDGQDINTDSGYQGQGSDRKISGDIRLNNKDTDKWLFNLSPTFYYSTKDRSESSNSVTRRADEQMNSSSTLSTTQLDVFNTRTDWSTGIKNMGKDRRSLTFSGNFTYRHKDGTSRELSETLLGSYADIRDLLYERNTDYLATEGVLSYVEPLGERWALQTRVTACYITQTDDNAAFNCPDVSANDYYSSYSSNQDYLLRERLLAQYEKDKTKAIFGIQIDQERNEIVSRSLGVENRVGQGEWVLNFAPYADVDWKKDNISLRASAGGSTNTPMGASIIPALNIANPVQISTGNIYLKPDFRQRMSFNFNSNNPKTFAFFGAHLSGNLNHGSQVYASWFDENGIRYAIPVNSQRPGYSVYTSVNFLRPVNKMKTLTLSSYISFNYSSDYSYQAKSRLPGLDKDNFDYAETMAWFWGGPNGDAFYSGRSGFAESRTAQMSTDFDVELEYTLGDFDFDLDYYAENVVSRYSLDPTANNSTWNHGLYFETLWSGDSGWEVDTDASYVFYRGYAAGYNDPEFIWNFKVSKEIGAFTISLAAADLLNQQKTLYRRTSAEYMEDTRLNVMGRYFLAGISFNFGKMNARNNERVQGAVWRSAM